MLISESLQRHCVKRQVVEGKVLPTCRRVMHNMPARRFAALFCRNM
jgi:hypothetical protein